MIKEICKGSTAKEGYTTVNIVFTTTFGVFMLVIDRSKNIPANRNCLYHIESCFSIFGVYYLLWHNSFRINFFVDSSELFGE